MMRSLKSFKYNYLFFLIILFCSFCAIDFLGSLSIIIIEDYTLSNFIIRIVKSLLGIPFFISLIIAPIILLPKRYIGGVVLLLWVYSVFAFVNQLYMRAFSTIMPFSMYTEFNNLKGLSDSILGIMSFLDIIYIIIPLLLTYWYFVIIQRINQEPSFGYRCKASLFIFGCSTLLFLPIVIQKTKRTGFTDSFVDILDGINVCMPRLSYQDFGLLPLIWTNYSLCEDDNKYILSEDDVNLINKHLEGIVIKDSIANTFYGNKSKNLILILVESLNSNAINYKVNDEYVMPNLCNYKMDSTTLYSDNLLDLEQAGVSIAGQFSLFTGLVGIQNTPFCIAYPFNNYPSIIRNLKEMDESSITSTIIVGTEKTYWRQNLVNISVGGDSLFGANDISRYSNKMMSWISDKDLFEFSYSKLNKASESPFILSIVTTDMHAPYIDKGNCTLDFNEKMVPELQSYYAKANETDRCIGDFIEKLKDHGIYDNSIIAIMADHNVPEAYLPGVKVSEDVQLNQISKYTPVLFLNTGVDQTQVNELNKDKVFVHQQIYPTLLTLFSLNPEGYSGLFPAINDIEACDQFDFSDISRNGNNEKLKNIYHISDMLVKSSYWGQFTAPQN